MAKWLVRRADIRRNPTSSSSLSRSILSTRTRRSMFLFLSLSLSLSLSSSCLRVMHTRERLPSLSLSLPPSLRARFSLYANNLRLCLLRVWYPLIRRDTRRIYITPRVYVGLRDRHGTGISVKSALSTATGPRLSYLAAISADIEIVSRGSWLATRSASLRLLSIPMPATLR